MNNLNVNSLSNARLIVYPNPVSENATLSIENLADKNVEITLLNILGSEVRSLFKGNIVSNYHEININFDGLNKGIYFVNIESENDVIITNKLVVE